MHKVVAVGSRSVEKAQEFIGREVKDDTAKAYGSYDEVFADKVCFELHDISVHALTHLDFYFRTLMQFTLARPIPPTIPTHVLQSSHISMSSARSR